MIGITWLLYGPLAFSGLSSPASLQSFALVTKLDSAPRERERIERELINRPHALLAVWWGTQRPNLEISKRCTRILQAWHAQFCLADILNSVDGDFDRFVNDLLYRPGRDLKRFEPASQGGRALDGYWQKYFPSLTENDPVPVSPFHDFSAYVAHHNPVLFFDNLLQTKSRDTPKCYFARCNKVKGFELYRSIVLSEGNVDLDASSGSLLISGGDVTIHRAIASLIIASGTVKITPGGNVGGLFVIAGEKVTIAPGHAGVVLVSPREVVVEPPGKLTQPFTVFDAKSKPAPGFFAFRDLWTADGLEARLDPEGRLRITTVRPDFPLAKLVKIDDIVVALANKNIESVGQFRRLLRYASDTGRFDLKIERDGQRLDIKVDFPKDVSHPR